MNFNIRNFEMKKIYIYFLLSLLLVPYSTNAQENNYWNIQYGTRSTILGGAVIGSVSDLSATFYNPGAIALFPDVKFILSAQIYQLDNYTIKDGAAEGKDLEYSSITPSPNFVAFDFDFDFLGDDRLALSVLTRQNTNFEFRTRLIDSLDVIESSPGKENFAGGVTFEKKFNDVWAGITYSTKLNEIFGVGFTGYFAYRSHNSGKQVVLQALKSDGEIASFQEIDNYRFNNLRTLLKMGFGVNLNPLTIGATVTTPSLNIFGSGSAGTHLFASGLDTNRFESNYQDEVKSKYNSSWTIGFGAAYTIDKIKLHFSTEWYDAIKKFFVLDTQPFISQSSGEILTNDLTHEAKSIINYGIGIDYFANESLTFSGSVVSDYAASVENSQTNLAPASGFDLIHLAAGSSFKIGKSEITVGAVYSFGSQIIKNDVKILPDAGSSIERDSEMKFSRIKLILGFEI